EWAHHVPHLFTAVDKLDRIYTRNTIASLQSKKISHNNQYKNLKIAEDIEAKNDYSKITSDILLEHFSAAAVLINEDLEIIHFHGDTSPFLRLASGKPSFSILSMARDELVFQLRNYILRAKNEKKSFSGEFISSKRQPFLNSFEIIYLPSHPELLLIIFYQNSISSSDSMDV
ncbi:MAG TPA: hypothetical protein VFQ56_05085, partial [Flavobacterium sp.]|nr:hypothetical protein [Flavobacterium sp.]